MLCDSDHIRDQSTTILLTQSHFHTKSYPRHAHDGYSISLVQEGIHHFLIEGEKREAAVGSVRIIHPYEAHETQQSTWKHINLSLETDTVEHIAHTLGIASPVIFAHLIYDSTLTAMIEQLYAHHTRSDERQVTLSTEALLFYLLERHHLDTVSLPRLALTPQMDNARSYIHTHAHEAAIDLEEIAKRAQMSKYHFLRLFKQTLGRTPHQYLQNIRIDRVRKMIAQGSTLSEAAHSCGFYDQSHMIHIYKKFYGHTPGGIRRKEQ